MQNLIDWIMENLALVIACGIIALFLLLIIYSAVHNRKHNTLVIKDGKLWKDRKHTFLGLPWSFTVYSMNEERLFVKTGFLSTVENEARLYRIMDIQLKRSFVQRIMGLGNIAVVSSDKSLKNFVITNITHPKKVKELLSQNVEEQRRANRVSNREVMGIDDDNDGDDIHETDSED